MLIKALELTERLQKTLGLRWTALMETLTQIAEKVIIKMDQLKLNQEILGINQQLQAAYRQLGQAVFRLQEGSISLPLMNDQIASHVVKIQQLSLNLKSLGRELSDLQDETFLEPLTDFLRMFQRTGGTLEPVTIPMGSPSSEKKLKELGLPSGTLVIGLQRKEQVTIPCGNTSVHPGDRLFLLTPVRELDEIQKIFQKFPEASTGLVDKL